MTAVLYIDHQGAYIGRDRNSLRIRAGSGPARSIPMAGLDRIVVKGSATIEVGALNLLWERGVSLLCLSGRHGVPAARLHGAPHKDTALRLAQYRAWHDGDLRLRWARELLALRLRILKRQAEDIAHVRRNGQGMMAPMLGAIARARRTAATAGSPDELRGVEGALAAAWFDSLSRLMPASLGFSKRQRRPPPDPVNALLSLGYTIATAEAARAAVRAGLDPAIGILHGLAHGREALALDLVEPARPLVDRMVHDLFHARDIEARHFVDDGKGGVILGKAGRRIFYEAWERKTGHQIRTLTRMLAREGARRLRKYGPGKPFADAGEENDWIGP